MKLIPGQKTIKTTVLDENSPEREHLLSLKKAFNEKLERDNPGEWLSWWIAEDAFELPVETIKQLERGGYALDHFFKVANDLFPREEWLQQRLEKRITPIYGLLNKAQQEACPVMPRPDVVLDQNWQPKFVELEITVCARFDTAVMDEQYGLDPNKSLVRNYAEYFKQRWPGKTLALLTAPHPLWWYIVDEAIPFAARLQREGLDVVVLEGANLSDLRFDGEHLVLCNRDGEDKIIHVIDRFIDIYELAELQHPGMSAILDAYLAGAVESVNTFKQFLDEKDWMSLFWDPLLRDTWIKELGEEHYNVLREMIPRTWVISSETQIELASDNTIPILDLKDLPSEERNFIVKESGTSTTSSGAQSLKILSELNSKEVQETLADCIQQPSPFIIQEIVDSPQVDFTALNPNDNDVVVHQEGARMKFSVFYIAGKMTNIKFIASNSELAVNNTECLEGIVRY